MRTQMARVAMLVALISGLTGYFLARKTSAGPQLGIGQPMCVSEVPSSWGQFKGGSEQAGFAFEDSGGTLRFVTSVPCGAVPQVALEIHRTK